MFLTSVFLLCIALTQAANSDGGKAPRIQLNDGTSIPAIGLGTFLGFDENGQKYAKEDEVTNAVKWSLDAGYRMIDTASAYKDEDQVGKGVKGGIKKRSDVYIVTKLGSHEKRDVVQSLRNSLARLNMDYVDLYLIHNPVSFTPDHKEFEDIDYLDTWKGMEEAQKLGLTKSIGISNFNISQMERLLANCNVKPAVLQVEVNLNLQQDKILEFCKKHSIAVMAYTPFGSLFDKSSVPPPPRVNDPKLLKIADKYKKTTPQVVLRFLIQRGVIPIPKSVNKQRIEENIDVFDFELTPEEMEELREFGKPPYRVVFPSFWQDAPYYPFEKKDVPDKSPFDGKKD